MHKKIISSLFISGLLLLPQLSNAFFPPFSWIFSSGTKPEDAAKWFRQAGQGLRQGLLEDPSSPGESILSKDLGKGLEKTLEKATDKVSDAFADSIPKLEKNLSNVICTYSTDKIRDNAIYGAVGISSVYLLYYVAKDVIEHYVKRFFKKKLAVTRSADLEEIEILLNTEADERLAEALAILANDEYEGELPNLLFFGPPGTGKTLTAEQIARKYDFDYYLISASAWFALPPAEAIEQMDDLFHSIPQNSRTMIFIDEADALLLHRNEQDNNDATRILTNFLVHTGKLSDSHFFVFATNRANKIDPAMQSRITYAIEFDLPDETTRHKLIIQYFEQEIRKAIPSSAERKQLVNWLNRNVEQWSQSFEGFSGRSIMSLSKRLHWKLISMNNPANTDVLDRFMAKMITTEKSRLSGLKDGLAFEKNTTQQAALPPGGA